MPRYVILRHEMPTDSERPLHWDLMLEARGVLRTWALDSEPAIGASTTSIQLADHRLAYLDYEGPVSGNRGEVTRFDAGGYEVVSDDVDRLIVRLSGSRMAGTARIERSSVGAQSWKVSFDARADSAAS